MNMVRYQLLPGEKNENHHLIAVSYASWPFWKSDDPKVPWEKYTRLCRNHWMSNLGSTLDVKPLIIRDDKSILLDGTEMSLQKPWYAAQNLKNQKRYLTVGIHCALVTTCNPMTGLFSRRVFHIMKKVIRKDCEWLMVCHVILNG